MARWSPSCRPPACSTSRELIELLLRRADEEQIATAVKARSGRRDGRVAAGPGQRRQCVDCRRGDGADPRPRPPPRPLRPGADRVRRSCRRRPRSRLTQVVGAGAAPALAGDAPTARRPTASWPRRAPRCSRRHDPAKRLEALAAALIRLLDEQGRLDDDLIAAAAEEGEVVLRRPGAGAPRGDRRRRCVRPAARRRRQRR